MTSFTPPILVSACLAGNACRYDGRHCLDPMIAEMVRTGRALALCPEKLGGMASPHPACELQAGTGEDVLDGHCRILDQAGADYTARYLAGSRRVLAVARKHHVREAWLKAKSPACGFGEIYNGRFSGELTPGNGVTAALLLRSGLVLKKIEATPSSCRIPSQDHP
jgi:uncharacterized protein YbbK (DUF523 family)